MNGCANFARTLYTHDLGSSQEHLVRANDVSFHIQPWILALLWHSGSLFLAARSKKIVFIYGSFRYRHKHSVRVRRTKLRNEFWMSKLAENSNATLTMHVSDEGLAGVS